MKNKLTSCHAMLKAQVTGTRFGISALALTTLAGCADFSGITPQAQLRNPKQQALRLQQPAVATPSASKV